MDVSLTCAIFAFQHIPQSMDQSTPSCRYSAVILSFSSRIFAVPEQKELLKTKSKGIQLICGWQTPLETQVPKYSEELGP